jgi:UDP:flavonoid glycosyltransferase YjiC (YdhE family)
MRFLLVPENNSLSHVAKCLAVRETLIERGHEALLAVSRRGAALLNRLKIPGELLPDIQGDGEVGFPNIYWFRRPRRLVDCIRAEADLIEHLRPDRVLGIFRFTLRAAARLAAIPCDSLLCGSMLPEMSEVLGFLGSEAGSDRQRVYLGTFFRYAAARMNSALESLGQPPVEDIRQVLKGERTFLWDFPRFQPLVAGSDVIHVGPIFWNRWPREASPPPLPPGNAPLAVLSFGTCVGSATVAYRLIRILLAEGFRVLLAAGGQTALFASIPRNPRLTVCPFVPLEEVLPSASLLVSHGGQMSLFEAIRHRVPVAVVPFQPEQAHNGVCLERLGCGRRLIGSIPFLGNPEVYVRALEKRSDQELRRVCRHLATDEGIRTRLDRLRGAMSGYRGAAAVAELLEEAV